MNNKNTEHDARDCKLFAFYGAMGFIAGWAFAWMMGA